MERWMLVDLTQQSVIDDLDTADILGIIYDIHELYHRTQNIQLVGYYTKLTKTYNSRRGERIVKETLTSKSKKNVSKNPTAVVIPMCRIRVVVADNGLSTGRSRTTNMGDTVGSGSDCSTMGIVANDSLGAKRRKAK